MRWFVFIGSLVVVSAAYGGEKPPESTAAAKQTARFSSRGTWWIERVCSGKRDSC